MAGQWMLEYMISFQKMEIISEYLNPQKSVEIYFLHYIWSVDVGICDYFSKTGNYF